MPAKKKSTKTQTTLVDPKLSLAIMKYHAIKQNRIQLEKENLWWNHQWFVVGLLGLHVRGSLPGRLALGGRPWLHRQVGSRQVPKRKPPSYWARR